MKPRWRFAIFFVAMLGVLMWQLGGKHGTTVRFGNETTLRFAGLTYDPPHVFVDGGLVGWLRYALSPKKPNSYSGGDNWMTLHYDPNAPVAWFVQEMRPDGDPSRPEKIEFGTMFDEHGCEIAVRFHTMFSLGRSQRHMFVDLPLDRLPPGGRSIGVRFWNLRHDAKSGPAAEFQVYSREPEPTPGWTPASLPQSQPFRDLTCTLRKVQARWVPYPEGAGLNGPGSFLTEVDLRLHRGTRPARDWQPVAVRFKDSVGNTLEADYTTTSDKKDDHHLVTFSAPVWKHVPAYDVEIELAPSRHAAVAPNTIATVRGLPMNGPYDERQEVPKTVRVGDRLVKVRTPVGGWKNSQPTTMIRLYIPKATLGKHRPIIISGHDDRGRSLGFPRDDWSELEWDYHSNGQEVAVNAPVLTAKDAKSLDVTFALVETETVRFRIKPDFSGKPFGLQPNRFK